MEKYLFSFVLAFILSGELYSQIRPDLSPIKSAEGTDEIYTMRGGVLRRVPFDSAKVYFTPFIKQTPLSFEIDSTGTNVVDSLRGYFVIDQSGDWWYVDGLKKLAIESGWD